MPTYNIEKTFVSSQNAHTNSKGDFIPKMFFRTQVLKISDVLLYSGSDLVWQIPLI